MRGFNKKFLLLISILFTFPILAGCETNSKDKSLAVPKLTSPQEIQGKLLKVSKGSISNLLTGSGTLVSGKTKELAFYANGVIKSINVNTGAQVKKGDTLAKLDTDKLMSNIEIQGLVLEKTQLLYDEMLIQKADEASLHQASLEVLQKKSQLDVLKEDLNKCVIIAPFDGIATQGSWVQVGQQVGNIPIFTIENTDTMIVKCSDENANKYRIGMKAEVSCDGTIYHGEVVSVGNIKREDKTKYSVLRLTETPNAKYYRASVGVVIEICKKDNVIVIPKSYIKSTNGYTYVYVVQNNIKGQRFVVKGIETDSTAEIVTGLKEGEELVDN